MLFKGDRVRLTRLPHDKRSYRQYGVMEGCEGIVERTSGGRKVPVIIDGIKNPQSGMNAFWLYADDLKLVKGVEDMKELDCNNVLIVEMLGDSYNPKKILGLSDENYASIKAAEAKYIIIGSAVDHYYLAKIIDITSKDTYRESYTQALDSCMEIVNVVDTRPYEDKKKVEQIQKELAEKKKTVEQKIKAEIDKLNNMALYEKMAAEHPENEALVSLVKELKGLENTEKDN